MDPEDPDETLGRQLDDYLGSLPRPGTDSSEPAPGEFTHLRPVVEQLYSLSRYLEQPGDRPPDETVTAAAAERVGKYQVVRPLGAGGQGSTLLAFDPDLRRHVVLKVYHARTAAEADALLREGQALARVRSPFVAQVYAAERAGEVPFLVVEHVPGRDLAAEMRARAVPVAEAVRVVARLAEGLAAVHACGLLHRDVKPANVLVGDDGAPRLVDFGLAVPLGGDDLGRVAGSLPYMAPEQARGLSDRIDPRTDLFGLGAVLYELLTGRPPHQADTRSALWEAAKAGDVAPVRARSPEVPADLAAVCERCLEKDPARRFASAAELAGVLRRWRPPRRVLRTLGPWLAAAAVLGAVVALWQVESAARSRRGFVPLPPPVPPAANDLGLTVRVGDYPATADAVMLTEGDVISIHVAVAKDAYVGAWYEDPDGNALMLFPNKFDGDHFVRAGSTRTIPGNPRYRIRVTPSKGAEYLRVLASSAKWAAPGTGLRSAGPDDAYAVYDTPAALRSLETFRGDLLRGLELVPQPGAPAGPGVQAPGGVEVLVRLHVRPRPDP